LDRPAAHRVARELDPVAQAEFVAVWIEERLPAHRLPAASGASGPAFAGELRRSLDARQLRHRDVEDSELDVGRGPTTIASALRDPALTPFRNGPATRYRALPAAVDDAPTRQGETMNEMLITPAGLARLEAELDRLRTEGRLEAAERLRDAATTEADVTESADYRVAGEEKDRLEMRIAQLELRLAATEVADADGDNGVIDLGERVRLRNLDTGMRIDYQVVGTLEADLPAGRISAVSPLGRALLGRRRG
jgi:transcription elongation factor GreA